MNQKFIGPTGRIPDMVLAFRDVTRVDVAHEQMRLAKREYLYHHHKARQELLEVGIVPGNNYFGRDVRGPVRWRAEANAYEHKLATVPLFHEIHDWFIAFSKNNLTDSEAAAVWHTYWRHPRWGTFLSQRFI